MANIILRTFILFITLLLMMRLMGKRQIGQLQPYEFALTLIAADLVTTPMSNINTPLLWGILPVFVLLTMGLTFSLLSLKSFSLRRLICGKPRILIERGVILEASLSAVRYTVNDLLEQLRTKDIFDISEVYYAVLETNGEISVIQKSAFRPATPDDLSLAPVQESITLALIIDGKISVKNLDYLNITVSQVQRKLKHFGINSVKDVLLMTYDGSKVYVHSIGASPIIREEKCVI